MKPETIAILSFFVSLIAFSWIGYIWLLYDTVFALGGVSSAQFPLVLANKIQTVGFLSFLGALGIAIMVYVIERDKS